jgi:hypothetical protein
MAPHNLNLDGSEKSAVRFGLFKQYEITSLFPLYVALSGLLNRPGRDGKDWRFFL